MLLFLALPAFPAEPPPLDRIEAVVSSRIPEDTQRTKAQKQAMQAAANALGVRLDGDSVLITSITRREVSQKADPELRRQAEVFSGPELRRRQGETWRAVLAGQVDQALLIQAALVSPGIGVDDDEIRAQIRRHLTDLRVPDEAHLAELLEAQGMTLAELKREYRVQLLSRHYLDQALRPSPPPGPGEVLQFYADHIAEFATPQEAQLRQIVLKKSAFPDRRAAEGKLRELLAALQSGGDFGELARKHSTSAFAAEGGLLPYQPVASLREDLQKLVRDCRSGHDCVVLETAEEYVIVRVDGLRQGHPRPSDEVQDEILERMRRSDLEERRTRMIQLLRLRASIRLTPEDAP